jgi:hypothetical protein
LASLRLISQNQETLNTSPNLNDKKGQDISSPESADAEAQLEKGMRWKEFRYEID